MAVNLDDKGLNSVVNKFDLFFIDIWGVVHNGIQLFENSINVLDELENLKKKGIISYKTKYGLILYSSEIYIAH